MRGLWVNHGRQARTIQVSVKDANFEAEFLQRERKIDRDSRLAYTALAARYSNNIAHAS